MLSQSDQLDFLRVKRDEILAAGLIVRFDKHGVLVACTTEHGSTPGEQSSLLPLDVVDVEANVKDQAARARKP